MINLFKEVMTNTDISIFVLKTLNLEKKNEKTISNYK